MERAITALPLHHETVKLLHEASCGNGSAYRAIMKIVGDYQHAIRRHDKRGSRVAMMALVRGAHVDWNTQAVHVPRHLKVLLRENAKPGCGRLGAIWPHDRYESVLRCTTSLRELWDRDRGGFMARIRETTCADATLKLSLRFTMEQYTFLAEHPQLTASRALASPVIETGVNRWGESRRVSFQKVRRTLSALHLENPVLSLESEAKIASIVAPLPRSTQRLYLCALRHCYVMEDELSAWETPARTIWRAAHLHRP